ncbi:MAG: hypothetical protein PWP15_63 [Methanothermococcus sp.]|uniref:DUF58 domain-containing protein n=1 Tax=Methanothermococcus TaxID=155862 RepID=UPI0003694ACC|nr:MULTISPECIES: DUF58 domain-containing protein [Methanothermococcus]MDK2789556.1 hypothetical protein [Methanothermococcus sp.]
MDKTLYNKILLVTALIFYANGYILSNLYPTLLGAFIFIYSYFTEKMFHKNLMIFKASPVKYSLIEQNPNDPTLFKSVGSQKSRPFSGDLVSNNIKLKEHHPSIILFKLYSKNIIPYMLFKSNNGTIKVINEKLDENMEYMEYFVEVTPHRKGELNILLEGNIFDKMELNSHYYSKSFVFQVMPSVEGLKHSIEKEAMLNSTIKFITEPEIDELKKYEFGEDVKRIDWKKSICINELIVRKMTYRGDSPIYYILDAGYSMRKSVDENKNKINYVTDILMSFLKSSDSENDQHLFIHDDYRILKSIYLEKNKLKNIMEKELLNLKPILLDKYYPSPITLYKDNKNKDFILHSYLSKSKKGCFGIFECAKRLIKMNAGTVMIFTDLDTNISPFLKSVNMLTRKGFKIIVYAVYSPSLNIKEHEIDEEILKLLYDHYLSRKKVIKNLRNKGITVVDLTCNDKIDNILKKLRRRKHV